MKRVILVMVSSLVLISNFGIADDRLGASVVMNNGDPSKGGFDLKFTHAGGRVGGLFVAGLGYSNNNLTGAAEAGVLWRKIDGRDDLGSFSFIYEATPFKQRVDCFNFRSFNFHDDGSMTEYHFGVYGAQRPREAKDWSIRALPAGASHTRNITKDLSMTAALEAAAIVSPSVSLVGLDTKGTLSAAYKIGQNTALTASAVVEKGFGGTHAEVKKLPEEKEDELNWTMGVGAVQAF